MISAVVRKVKVQTCHGFQILTKSMGRKKILTVDQTTVQMIKILLLSK